MTLTWQKVPSAETLLWATDQQRDGSPDFWIAKEGRATYRLWMRTSHHPVGVFDSLIAAKQAASEI